MLFLRIFETDMISIGGFDYKKYSTFRRDFRLCQETQTIDRPKKVANTSCIISMFPIESGEPSANLKNIELTDFPHKLIPRYYRMRNP